MIVWVASYPRSGNGFFMTALHHLYGINHYSIYKQAAKRANPKLVTISGLKESANSLEEMARSPDLFFVKTHELPQDDYPAVYLVRDGRDSLTSYAHFIQDVDCDNRNYQTILGNLILEKRGWGDWSTHVLTWTQRKAPTVILRFEYLIQNRCSQKMIEHVFKVFDLGQLPSLQEEELPKFQELHAIAPNIFRSGKLGQWTTEISEELQHLFWQHHGYAMQKMGYVQSDVFRPIGVEFFNAISLEQTVPEQKQLISEPEEPISEPELVSNLISELRAKEATIQNMAFFLRLSPAYWLTVHIRPFLKKVLGKRITTFIRRNRNQLSLEPQFKPRPIRLPRSYFLNSSILKVEMPRISIVTPSLNQAQYISQTIESVLSQNYPNLEYFIQDALSTDGTSEIVNRYASPIIHCESMSDFGQAHAINLGFQKTTGKIMAWLNADDLFLPGSLDYIAQFFIEHPDVDVVYGHRILINEWGQEFGRWILPTHEDEILSWADYVPQETLFWRRELWDKVGSGLNESYQFAMDWELLLRFREAGAKFVRLPRFLGAFRVHNQQKTTASYAVGEQEMKRLRWMLHGESISQFKVDQQVKKYLKCANRYRIFYQAATGLHNMWCGVKRLN
jgi:glycosyltransferase involved in cell wall biosynthesis